MKTLSKLFENNRRWVESVRAEDPQFFDRLAAGQSPKYLWIGCSDSRVPANQLLGLLPGDIFVHRNVANIVVHTDLNCLSVLQYAVDVLKVEHVIVCGHYGCGGVRGSLEGVSAGLVDNWLRHVRDVAARYRDELRALDVEARISRLCELNVAAQVVNVCATTIVQEAWARGRPLMVHGWIYDVANGLLQDLDLCMSAPGQLPNAYRLLDDTI